MKKIMVLLILCLLCVSPALAETRVFDRANVLSDRDEMMLEQEIASIQAQYQFDVVILTEQSIGGQAVYDYSESFYERGNFGYGEDHDGIMLLLVTGGGVGNRDYDICSTGRSQKIFGVRVLNTLEDDILPYLIKSEYASGISCFVRLVSEQLNDYLPQNRVIHIMPFILIAGLVVGLTVAFVLRHQMRTVRRKPDAASYIREGSSHITRSEDVYLYTTTTRRRIESSSPGGGGHGVSRSGGGHTHRSGKF